MYVIYLYYKIYIEVEKVNIKLFMMKFFQKLCYIKKVSNLGGFFGNIYFLKEIIFKNNNFVNIK